MSLADCLSKFGKTFSPDERAALFKARKEHVAAGLDQRTAEIAVVQAFNTEVQTDREALLGEIAKAMSAKRAPTTIDGQAIEEPAELEEPVEAYATREEAAAAAAKQSREMKLRFKPVPHPTEKGAWTTEQVLRTEAQAAADRRTAARALSNLRPDESRDTITTFIAKMGGLRLSEAPDITRDRYPVRAPNHPMLYLIRRKGGMGVDALGEYLYEAGYFAERPDEQEIRDAISAELDGKDHYSFYGSEAQAQASQRDEELQAEAIEFAESAGVPELEQVSSAEDVANHHNFVPANESQLTGPRLALMELTQRAVELDEGAVERLAIEFEGNDAAYAGALQEIINANDESLAGRDARVGEAVEPLALTGETEVERQAREEGERAGRDRAEREASERDARDRADRERADFGLTGSERAADANANQGNLYNLRYSKTIQRTSEETASRPRIYVSKELKRLVNGFDEAIIAGRPQTGNELANKVEELVARIESAKEPQFRKRVRGTDWIKERLLRARRLGELSEEAVDIALWFVEQNPNVTESLGISVGKAQGMSAGHYNPASQIIRLSKESENSDTAVHEILHHTERMMPDDVRNGIQGEWLRQMSAAYRSATTEDRKILKIIMGAAADEPTAKRDLKTLMDNGKFPYPLYQYVNPSEFWAVNGARIMSSRYGAEQSGWIAKARQWLSEFIEKLKSLLGLASDAPVIRGLRNTLETEGKFVQTEMIANAGQFLSPDGIAYSIGPTPQNQATPAVQQNYVVSASRALKQAQASPPPNSWEADAGLLKRMLVTPRTIAAFDRDFVPVYQTAVEQWKFRDQLIAKFERLAEPYFKAPKADQEAVNKVLEHDRLTGQVGLAGQNMTVHFTSPEAQLSRPGERLTVTDAQKTAYWSVRNMLNEALNEFRDQTLEDFNLPRGTTAAQVQAMAAQQTVRAEAQRLIKIADILQGIEDARRTGYVPFSRYGEIGITVRHPLTKALLHYEMIEPGMLQRRGGKQLAQMPEVKARLAALRAKYPGQTISEPFQVPKAGMPPQVKLEEVDALAEMAKIDNATWDSVRQKLEQAVAGQGFRAHFFRAKNTPGYSADFERGLANYVNGISGYLARRRYASKWVAAIAPISGNKAKLRQYAQDYQKYVNSPAEEFSFLRSANFVYYLTSVATWITNLTQVPFVSMPWTTQFVNPAAVTAAFLRAEAETTAMLTLKNGVQLYSAAKAPADVRAAVQAAYDQGLFIPITTYESMGIARNQGRRLRNVSKAGQLAIELFGLGFTMAERHNRIATFIALYRLARDRPEVAQNFARVMAKNALGSQVAANWSPQAFAEFGIDDTHFKSGKVNRPTIARNAGTVVFQFKMFMWNMLERMVTQTALQGSEGRAATALMLMVMGLMAGVWGLPGAENMRDLWEFWMKKVKNRDVNADAEMRKILVELGASASQAEMVSGGAPRGLPEPWNIDLSKRLGMGKILPSEPGEILGVSYDLWFKRPNQAMEQFEVDNLLLGLAELSPKQAADIMTQLAWSEQGVRTKAGDRPVIPKEEVTAGMRVAKAIGFTPGTVSNIREAERAEQIAKTAANEARTDFYRRMAKVVAEGVRAEQSGDLVAAVKADMDEEVIWSEIEKWNKAHPEDYLQVRLDRKTARANLAKEFEGADYDKGTRKQARGEVDKLRRVYGRP